MLSKRTAVRVAEMAASVLLLGSCIIGCGSYTPPPITHGSHAEVTPTTPTAAGALAWSITPIDAVFSQACYCTDYQVKISAPNHLSSNDQWRVTWTIKLILVDSAGAPDPSTPGSGAAVDSGCDNNGKATSSPFVESISPSSTTDLTWYHPDASSSVPGGGAGSYHCNHQDQGPHGHQGLVSAVITHGAQTCRVSYWGTHTGNSGTPDQPGDPTCGPS